jgi:hypothetical protein
MITFIIIQLDKKEKSTGPYHSTLDDMPEHLHKNEIS